jgi:hypothetical protein
MAQQHHKWLNLGLWAAQILLAAAFGFFGFIKATQSVAGLAPMMHWVTPHNIVFVHTLGVLEVLGAVGVTLPWLTRIQPRLTVAAALCFVMVQVLAIGFHASRGETATTIPLNLVLLGLAAFVFWGRNSSAGSGRDQFGDAAIDHVGIALGDQ